METGTEKASNEWMPIIPGTEAALLLGIVHVLFAEQRVRLGDLEGKVNGLAELQAVAADFSPEYVAAFCDIPPARIRLLAREISEARTAAIYGQIGRASCRARVCQSV